MAYGLEVAVLGVAVVFAFLTTLVLSIQLLGWFFQSYGHLFPEPAGKAVRGGTERGVPVPRIAAAVAAIEAHRRRGGR